MGLLPWPAAARLPPPAAATGEAFNTGCPAIRPPEIAKPRRPPFPMARHGLDRAVPCHLLPSACPCRSHRAAARCRRLPTSSLLHASPEISPEKPIGPPLPDFRPARFEPCRINFIPCRSSLPPPELATVRRSAPPLAAAAVPCLAVAGEAHCLFLLFPFSDRHGLNRAGSPSIVSPMEVKLPTACSPAHRDHLPSSVPVLLLSACAKLRSEIRAELHVRANPSQAKCRFNNHAESDVVPITA